MSTQLYFTMSDLKAAFDNNYIDQLGDENRDSFLDKINFDYLHEEARSTFEFFITGGEAILVNSVVPEFIRHRMVTVAIYYLWRRKGLVPAMLKDDYNAIMAWLQSGDFSNLNVSLATNKISGNMFEEDLGTLDGLYPPWTEIL